MTQGHGSSALRSAGILAMLMGLGYLGNYFSIALFFGVDILWGSIAVLIIIALYGWSWGLLAGLVASSYTYTLWGHPYAVITFSLESLFVGLFLHFRKDKLLIVDGIFWLLIGVPSVWLLYGVVGGMDSAATSLIALKQAVNGICNALLASLAINHLPLRKALGRPDAAKSISYDESMFNLLVAMVLIPTFMIVIQNGKKQVEKSQSDALGALPEISAVVTNNLNSWYEDHLNVLKELAAVARDRGMRPSAELQGDTALVKRGFPDLQTMYVANAEGLTIAYEPPINDKGDSTIGMSFADRPYFQQAKLMKQPNLSEVIMGRGGVSSPIAAISAPILKEDSFVGLVSATLDLRRIQNILEPYGKEGAVEITVVDPKGQVIAATVANRDAMQIYDPKKGWEVKALGVSTYQRFPLDKKQPEMVRWKKSFYVLEKQISAEIPWTLIVESPVAPLQKHLHSIYVQNFLTMAVLVVLVLFLAHVFVRWLIRPLDKLTVVTTDLPLRLQAGEGIEWPESSATEIESLIGNFRSMTDALKRNFRDVQEQSAELTSINRDLKVEINDRKAAEEALRQSEAKFKRLSQEFEALLDAIPDEIVLISRELRVVWVNQSCAKKISKDVKALIGCACDTLWDCPKEAEAICPARTSFRANRPADACITGLDGRTREIRSVPVRGETGEVSNVIELIRDITEQRQLEQHLQETQKMAAVGTLAGGIAHEFNNILGIISGSAELVQMSLSRYAETVGLSATVWSETESYLKEVSKSCRRAKELVRQMLIFSNRKDQERKPLQVGDVIEEILKWLRTTLPETIEIRHSIESDGMITADQVQIHQLLMNLCMNAQHAMQEKGGMLKISLTDIELDKTSVARYPGIYPGPHIQLIVADTGCGMDSETVKRIFDPFFTTKGPGGGIGLGLAVVHGIVEGLGGWIDVRSQLGSGTTFEMIFPRTDDGQSASADHQLLRIDP